MHGSPDSLGMGFGLGGMGLVVWVIVVLAVAALVKYVFYDNRR